MTTTKPWIVAVSGGSGSGKTTLAKKILQISGAANCVIVSQDSYYLDQSKNFDRDGGSVNFDHPNSIDFTLLADHLKILKSGRSVQIPIYDFSTHSRKKTSVKVEPHRLILVDGILILSQPLLRPLFDESLFIEAAENLRFERRLRRDVKERGRTPGGVREQFYTQVKPMHDQYVEPSMAYASILISGDVVRTQKMQTSAFQKKLLSTIDQAMNLP